MRECVSDKMAGSQAQEVIPSTDAISTYSKKIVQLVLRMQYPDSIKVTSGNLDDVLTEINQVSGDSRPSQRLLAIILY